MALNAMMTLTSMKPRWLSVWFRRRWFLRNLLIIAEYHPCSIVSGHWLLKDILGDGNMHLYRARVGRCDRFVLAVQIGDSESRDIMQQFRIRRAGSVGARLRTGGDGFI